MKKQTDLNLTEGPIFKKLLLFTWPILLRSLVATLYNTADAVMLGQFVGANAMAAANAAMHSIYWLDGPLQNITLGTTVICSMYFGSGEHQKLQEATHTAIAFGLLSSFVVLIIGVALIQPLLTLNNVPAEITGDTALYMLVRLIGLPISISAGHCSGVFFARGNTKLPMITSLSSGFLNVLLNALFLIVLRLGVIGVALATIISQGVDCVIYMIVLYGPKNAYGLKLKELKIRWEHLKQILSVGIPSALNSFVFSISNIPLQATLNGFGPLVIAGRSAANTLCDYTALVQNSMSSAVLSVTGQCYGSGKYKRIGQVAKIACFGSAGIIAAISLVFIIFSRFLLGLVNSDPEVIEQGIPYLLCYGCGMIIYTFTVSLSSSLKGIKKATQATIATSVSIIIPRLLWVWIAMPYLKTLNWLYAIYPISWAISSVTVLLVYLHYREKLPSETINPYANRSAK